MTEINHTPGVCGGDACVNDTRIAVWLVMQSWYELDDYEAVAERWSFSLTYADVMAAIRYARAHPKEIDKAIADNDRALRELQAQG